MVAGVGQGPMRGWVGALKLPAAGEEPQILRLRPSGFAQDDTLVGVNV